MSWMDAIVDGFREYGSAIETTASALPGPGDRGGGGSNTIDLTGSIGSPNNGQRFRGDPLPPPGDGGSDPEPYAPSGGDSGGGGGGGGYAAPSVSAVGAVNAGVGDLEQARRQTQEAAAGLEARYESDKAELREQYQFAETDQERQILARALGELEHQRDQGLAAIDAGYAQTQAEVEARSGDMRDQAGLEAEAMAALFGDQAAAMRAGAGQVDGDRAVSGLGVNADGGGTEAELFASMLDAAAPREAALTQRLGDIGADDVAWLADTLGGESLAQQADLRRLAQTQIGQAQQQHDRRVQDRIQQDRTQWRDQLGGLQGDFRGREWQLEDTDMDLLSQLGQMRQQAAEAAAARRQSASEANARMAASARAAASRGSGGGGGSSMPQPGTLEGGLFALDVDNQYGPPGREVLDRGGYDTGIFGGGPNAITDLMSQASGYGIPPSPAR